VEVKVKVARFAADRFRRAWPGGVTDEKPVKDGVLMTVLADECEWLVNWLLAYGDSVEVIAPETLRAQLVVKALAVARHHGADIEANAPSFSRVRGSHDPLRQTPRDVIACR
jgi:predicted DNA-binding transcriptional regulator YafY